MLKWHSFLSLPRCQNILPVFYFLQCANLLALTVSISVYHLHRIYQIINASPRTMAAWMEVLEQHSLCFKGGKQATLYISNAISFLWTAQFVAEYDKHQLILICSNNNATRELAAAVVLLLKPLNIGWPLWWSSHISLWMTVLQAPGRQTWCTLCLR